MKNNQHNALLLLLLLTCSGLTGCTAILNPIDSIPADRVPPQFLAQPQANKVQIDLSRLRQRAPRNYILDARDILGVFIEGVLGGEDEAPPVKFPDPGSDLPPAIGFPVPIREDGTISVPLVDPIPLKGLTLQQAEQLIKRTYIENGILQEGARFIVTLMQERTYRVFVIRQDNGNSSFNQNINNQQNRGRSVTDRSDQSARGSVLQLAAGKNDVLNALAATGGLPGLNAKPEIRILRGDRIQYTNRDRQMSQFYNNNNANRFPYGEIPLMPDDNSTLRIPLRLYPGETANFRPEDIILRDGDVVYVDSRETEVYYTGGMMQGGEWPLPRDYDLDVISAISLTGEGVGVSQAQRSGGGGLIGASGITVPPTDVIILRRLPGQRQIAIRVSLNEAVNDPRKRLLIKAGDMIILRFKPGEELINFGSAVFFTYGIQQIFNNRN